MTPPSLVSTYRYFKADVHRLLYLQGRAVNFLTVLTVLPKRAVVSVFIYRVRRYLHFKNNLFAKILVRLLRFPEFHYCHNELDPRADIGPGLVLGDLGGIGFGYNVIIGKNCTFMGKATPTLGAMEGVDVEKDRIRIGDDCVFGHNAKIINPVTVADGVQVTANTVVMTSIKVEGTVMAGYPAKSVEVLDLAVIKTWSPLLSRHLQSGYVS